MKLPSNTCLSCEGRCCSAYIVPVNGNDVWRIVQEQRLSPGLFVQREPEDYATSTGFLLRQGGQTYTISLRHQYDRRNERPCIFLVQLRDGIQRCGIYSHRPRACRTYPMQLRDAIVTSRNDMLCPAGSWSGITQHPEEWREELHRQDDEWEQYATVVQAWNRSVNLRPAHEGCVLDQFLAYVLAAYDVINTGDGGRSDTSLRDSTLKALAEACTANG